MAIKDIVVEDGRCVYRPILAEAGDTLTCPNGHAVADIVKDIRLSDRTLAELFTNWRGREGWTPGLGDPAAGIPGDLLPMCPVCGADPWVGPQGDFRPRTQNGFRCLPGDPQPDDPEKEPRMTIQIDNFKFIGSTIDRAIERAIDMARAAAQLVAFDFNGTTVTVAGDSDAMLIYRDWGRSMDGKIAKAVGPYPAAVLTETERANDALIDAETLARREAQAERWREEEALRTAAADTALAAAPAMTRDEAKWQLGVDAQNGSAYGLCVFRFAEDWARLMQGRIEAGENLADVADACCFTADGKHGITGFMYGCAVSILAEAWVYGEPLRRWHNAKYGRDDATGTVNPAVLTIAAKP